MSRENSGGRRSGRRTGAPLTILQRAVAASDGLPFFVVDEVILSLDEDSIRAVVDQSDSAHWLDQPDDTKQCALPAAHANFAGQLCLNFTGTQWYASNRAALYWAFLHNTVGSAMRLSLAPTVFDAANIYGSTHPVSSSVTTGSAAFANGTTGRWCVGNGVSALINTSPASTFALDTPLYLDLSFLDGAPTPEWAFRRRGSVLTSGDATPAPTSAAPPAPFTWGAGAGTASFPGKFRGRHVIFTPPTSSAREIDQQYLSEDSELAA